MTSHPGLPVRSAPWALAALFLALASWVEFAGRFPGDQLALVELSQALGTTIDGPMVLVGDATDVLPLGAIAVVIVALLVRVGRRFDALVLGVIVGIVFAMNPLLKYIIARSRPAVRLSPEVLSTHSFPSGHAASTAALVGALVLVVHTRRRRIAAAVLGTLVLIVVGFSRLAIGAHYPSDIVGGWLWVGSLIGFVWAAQKHARITPHQKSGVHTV